MDGLTNKQRAMAWISSWNPNLIGMAIVNQDFTFRSVNDQFCEFLAVTPAELLDKSFVDITPEPAKTLDVENATRVIEGKSLGYLMRKVYHLKDGRDIPVTLLVSGVRKENNDFDFFVARIVPNPQPASSDASPSPKGQSLWGAILKYWQIVSTGVFIIAWIVYQVFVLKNGLQTK